MVSYPKGKKLREATKGLRQRQPVLTTSGAGDLRTVSAKGWEQGPNQDPKGWGSLGTQTTSQVGPPPPKGPNTEERLLVVHSGGPAPVTSLNEQPEQPAGT